MISYIPFLSTNDTNGMVSAVNARIGDQDTGYCIVQNGALSPEDFMNLLDGAVGESFTVSLIGSRRVGFDLVQDRGDYAERKESSILSASNLEFPMHTDCSFLERPADIVILYCLENAESGGESLLLNINNIIPLLPADYTRFLLTKKYTVYSKEYPVLEKGERGYFIRFNLGEFLSVDPPDRDSIIEELKSLTGLLADPAHVTTVKLRPHECLIINNRTCLHGRHGFEGNSRRLFYRARHYRKV